MIIGSFIKIDDVRDHLESYKANFNADEAGIIIKKKHCLNF